jgi:hypothetical protein
MTAVSLGEFTNRTRLRPDEVFDAVADDQADLGIYKTN